MKHHYLPSCWAAGCIPAQYPKYPPGRAPGGTIYQVILGFFGERGREIVLSWREGTLPSELWGTGESLVNVTSVCLSWRNDGLPAGEPSFSEAAVPVHASMAAPEQGTAFRALFVDPVVCRSLDKRSLSCSNY